MKPKVIITILAITILASCNKSSPQKEKINMRGGQFDIDLHNDNTTIYISLNSYDDSLYIGKFGSDDSHESVTIKASKLLITKIKKNVLYHTKPEFFFRAQGDTSKYDKRIRFSIEYGKDVLEAVYPDFRLVSPKFDSLLTLLKNEDKNIDVFFSTSQK